MAKEEGKSKNRNFLFCVLFYYVFIEVCIQDTFSAAPRNVERNFFKVVCKICNILCSSETVGINCKS